MQPLTADEIEARIASGRINIVYLDDLAKVLDLIGEKPSITETIDAGGIKMYVDPEKISPDTLYICGERRLIKDGKIINGQVGIIKDDEGNVEVYVSPS